MKTHVRRKALKAAFPYTVPIFAGFRFPGLAYGIYMNASGFSFLYPMTMAQQIITIAICTVGTMATRFLPFAVFSSKKPTPKYIQYLGKIQPAAIYGMPVVYCLKDVSVLDGSHGIPELIAICVVVGLHLWKRQMLLSIAGGTAVYMLLIHFVF